MGLRGDNRCVVRIGENIPEAKIAKFFDFWSMKKIHRSRCKNRLLISIMVFEGKLHEITSVKVKVVFSFN